MKGKTRFAVLVAMTGAVALGLLLIPKSEAAASRNVPLAVSFRGLVTDPSTADRILGDGKGSYVNGEASAGTVEVHLYTYNRGGGGFYMYLDNGGNETLGRAVGFLFHDYAYPCSVDAGIPDSTLYKDFEVGPGSPVVKSRWVKFLTYYKYVLDPADGFYHESLEILNFLAIGANEVAYVGMSMNFGMTLENGAASDDYYLGFIRDPVEVRALSFDANGKPKEWSIRTIQDPNVYTKIHEDFHLTYVPARMLAQIHYPPGPGKKSYQAQCYGHYNVPFELHLTRMQ